jgi:hypothetical protein
MSTRKPEDSDELIEESVDLFPEREVQNKPALELPEYSSKVLESTVPNRTRDLDIWTVPSSTTGTSQVAFEKLATHKDGKDYRFSYIATTHTHSTSSYADVVRERYFPNEDNEYWSAALPKESPPELALHISRSGEILRSGPDNDESWLPPETVSSKSLPASDSVQYYPPPARSTINSNIAEEKYQSSCLSGVTDDEEWVPPSADSKSRSARIDFTGAVASTEESSGEFFKWNPTREPSPESIVVADVATEINPPLEEEELKNVPEVIGDEVDDDDDDENSKARSKEPEMPKRAYRRSILLVAYILIIPAAAFVILFVFVDILDKNTDDSSSGSGGGDLSGEPSSSSPTFPSAPSLPSSPVQSPSSPASLPSAPTIAGSPPSSAFEPTDDVLLGLLSSVTPNGGAALRDTTSPQYQAMEWIRTPHNQGIYSDRIFLQRYALATLYYSTGGEQWTVSDDWLSETTECDWFSSSSLSRICDDDGNIVELNLANNNLRGKVPPELGVLANRLLALTLSKNKLTGDIPSSLSRITSLSK